MQLCVFVLVCVFGFVHACALLCLVVHSCVFVCVLVFALCMCMFVGVCIGICIVCLHTHYYLYRYVGVYACVVFVCELLRASVFVLGCAVVFGVGI